MKHNESSQIHEEGKLKVYSKYFKQTHKGVSFPEIRLCGKWLQNTGFLCGQSVSVKSEKNKITITLIDTSK